MENTPWKISPYLAHCVYGCAWYVNIVEVLDYTNMSWIVNLFILIKASIKTDDEIFLSLQMFVAVLVLNVSVYVSFDRIFADEMFLDMVDEISLNLPVFQLSIHPIEQYANEPGIFLKKKTTTKNQKPKNPQKTTKTKHSRACILVKFPCWNHVGEQRFSNLASDWLAVQPPANQKPR